MPRYIVERTYPDGVHVQDSQEVVDRNADHCVTWVHSFVAEDRKKTFCLYDAPTPEAIRRASARNALPIDRITQVTVLDPYVYR